MPEQLKTSQEYPALRNLQFSPVKQGEEQFMVLWDPTGLSREKLILPLNYFYLVQFFDGEHSLDQIGVEYLKKFGEFFLPDRLTQLVADLEGKLFLEGESFEAAKAAALKAYRESPTRPVAFAGKNYESEPDKLRTQLDGFFKSKEGPGNDPSENQGKRIKAIVAPNYDLQKAGPLYAWAYKELRDAHTPEVFILIGTCHAGLAGGVTITQKDFETPLGVVPSNGPILDYIRTHGGEEFFEEEIRFQQEHSLEFQLPLLQHTIGSSKSISIVPILVSFPPVTLIAGQLPELAERVGKFLSILKAAIQASGQEVCVIGSANLAHIGLRFGDDKAPTDFSFHRCMQTDLEMLKHVENIDPDNFVQFLITEQDKRRVLGFSVIYLLLKLIDAEKGEVLRYDREIADQFNSTITYASMAFY